MRRFPGALLASLLIFLTSCASDKVPAEQALKTAETAVGAVQAEAAKWVPDQAKALDASVAALRDKLAKKEYKAVLADAPAVGARAQEVAASAAAKKPS
jgi:hypothetical protein